MSYQTTPPPAAPAIPAAQMGARAQRAFMTRVYGHLMLAIAAFVAVEYGLFVTGLAGSFLELTSNVNWLLILGGFMVASWMAQRATASTSRGVQYAGLFGLVAAYALIFTPMIARAALSAPDGTIALAGVITLVGFVALSGIAITTAVDFSFMRSLLMWGGAIALGLIVLGVFGLIDLGTWFSVAMIALAGGAVLYDTQKIYHNLPANREVGAAASLFASVALLFFYVLRLLSRR